MKIETYDGALTYATAAHVGQVRKGTAIPYITHPTAVAALVRNSAATMSRLLPHCSTTSSKIAG
jgi:(p)ppGpp synthase/HD superfamily hydrolase